MIRIGIVTASTPPRRIGHHITAWVTGPAPDDVELVTVDLREMALPLTAARTGRAARVSRR